MNNILEYLERSAERFADKKAVAYGDQSLTFAQLRSAAYGLGEKLLAGSGDVVAVFANRGVECTVGFLASVRAGAMYLPLDPELPEYKLRAIVEDSGAVLLLGTEDNRALADAAGLVNLFQVVDAFAECPNGATDSRSFEDFDPDTPLFLMYTSGSTGKPKGVLKSHGAIISFIEAFLDEFGLGAGEVIGNQTPFFFDASAKDLYFMLAAGATMEIIPSEKFVLPVTLVEYLNEKRITYAAWVPTAFAGVTQLKTFSHVTPQTLRHAFFVGEVFPRKQLAAWIEALPQIEYVNLYGSTETAGIVCFYRIDVNAELPEPIPMGKPLRTAAVCLRGEDGQKIVEAGVVGEVCISGPQLATCYYNDEEKTAERFVDIEGVRTLRTGDLASYDELGNLVFASRSDYQIKHQGRRIELGEIESHADGLEEIQRCACVYDSEKKKIILFCELVEGAEATQKTIRAALKERVNGYMVPGKVVIMERLPYNANGKIDRPALQALL